MSLIDFIRTMPDVGDGRVFRRPKIEARLDLETAERSGGSRSTGKMDRATRPRPQFPTVVVLPLATGGAVAEFMSSLDSNRHGSG